MAEFTFNFCVGTRAAEVIAPEETQVKDFNGWDYTPNPVLPYRRGFKVHLDGLRWYLDTAGTALDLATNVNYNAGLLETFYKDHRMHKPFNFQHEYLGLLECRFSAPVSMSAAIPDSGGLLERLTIQMIHHNPSY